MRRLAVCISLLLILCPLPGMTKPYPEVLDIHINDFSEVIDSETETNLRIALSALRNETGIEFTIVTIRSRKDFDPSASLEVFARGLFNSWGVGNAEHNDGIMMLVVTADRETRIELGAAYDQAYDVIAQDIIMSNMIPDFRESRFNEGVASGAIEIIDRIALSLAETSPNSGLPDASQGLFERLDGWIFGAVFVGIAAFGLFGRRAGDALMRFRRCPGCGRRGLSRHHVNFPAQNETAPGRVGTRVTCRHCDYRDEAERRVTRQRTRRADRGLGGGRSSGGGASGRW